MARDLLGARLESTVGGRRAVGAVTETEAYLGPGDPASHAATKKGMTSRNRAMYGPPGTAYVYLIYGMHWCLNVVTGSEGEAQAVLIRGLEPVEGLDVMRSRRGRDAHLTDGPGRLASALGVTGELYGHDLRKPPLRVVPGNPVPEGSVLVTGRVGVKAAADWPLRFLVDRDRGAP